jgi:hypothetical protein
LRPAGAGGQEQKAGDANEGFNHSGWICFHKVVLLILVGYKGKYCVQYGVQFTHDTETTNAAAIRYQFRTKAQKH